MLGVGSGAGLLFERSQLEIGPPGRIALIANDVVTVGAPPVALPPVRIHLFLALGFKAFGAEPLNVMRVRLSAFPRPISAGLLGGLLRNGRRCCSERHVVQRYRFDGHRPSFRGLEHVRRAALRADASRRSDASGRGRAAAGMILRPRWLAALACCRSAAASCARRPSRRPTACEGSSCTSPAAILADRRSTPAPA